MMELPYKKIPFKTDGTDLLIYVIKASGECKHQMIIVSGARSSNDVMRGEETLIAGCGIANTEEEQLFIFPGTHSKHAIVQNGMVKGFETYVTGEIFDLLSTRSILAASVENVIATENCNSSFLKGVEESITSNLLNSIFHVRTNQLFERLGKKENYHYLSGLLIGTELKELVNKDYSSITLVSTGTLLALYEQALIALGFKEKLKLKNADEALINGQCLIAGYY
jgi:2-dehydro-3-deoxygalactonokinase